MMSSTEPGPATEGGTPSQDAAIQELDVEEVGSVEETERFKKRFFDMVRITGTALLLLLILVLPFGWTLFETTNVSTAIAPILAIAAAGCILTFGALSEARPEMRVTMGEFGLALAGVMVITGGVLAMVFAGGGGPEPHGPGGTVNILATADITFDRSEWSVPEGEVTFVYEDGGDLLHTLVIEGMEDEMELRVNGKGEVDSGTVNLPPGTYTLFCTIRGHRELGMEGQLTVERSPGEPPPPPQGDPREDT